MASKKNKKRQQLRKTARQELQKNKNREEKVTLNHAGMSLNLARRNKKELDHGIISQAATILGRKGGTIGGKSTSDIKTAWSRKNGKLGGRPPKNPKTQSATKETQSANFS